MALWASCVCGVVCGYWCRLRVCMWEVLMGSHKPTAEHSAHCRLMHSRSGITVHPVSKQMLQTKHVTPMKRPPNVPTSPFQRGRWKRTQYSSTYITLAPNTHTYSLSLIDTGLHNRKTTCLRQGTQTSRQLQAIWHSIVLSSSTSLQSDH